MKITPRTTHNPQHSAEWESIEGRPSKTALKKEVHRLRDLSEKLTELSKKQIKSMGLTEETLYEIETYHQLSSHEAKRRQLQRIAKLLRHESESDLMYALSKGDSPKRKVQLEKWVERVIEQGDHAIQDFAKQYHEADRHTLRQHMLRVQRSISIGESEDEQKKHIEKLRNYIVSVAVLSD